MDRNLIAASNSALDADDPVALSELVPAYIGLEEPVQHWAGRSVLIAAAISRASKCVRFLLEAGASVEGYSPDGDTALICGAKSADVTRLLLDAGADPNAQSTLGGQPYTPLWACLFEPDADVAAFTALLAAGADPFAAEGIDGTPAEYAKGQFKQALERHLREEE